MVILDECRRGLLRFWIIFYVLLLRYAMLAKGYEWTNSHGDFHVLGWHCCWCVARLEILHRKRLTTLSRSAATRRDDIYKSYTSQQQTTTAETKKSNITCDIQLMYIKLSLANTKRGKRPFHKVDELQIDSFSVVCHFTSTLYENVY